MYPWSNRVNPKSMTIERKHVTSLMLIYYLLQAECEDQRESNRSLGRLGTASYFETHYCTDISTEEQLLAPLSQINNNAPLHDVPTPPAQLVYTQSHEKVGGPQIANLQTYGLDTFFRFGDLPHM
jgi:hypothetical protein